MGGRFSALIQVQGGGGYFGAAEFNVVGRYVDIADESRAVESAGSQCLLTSGLSRR